jgi:hypothetical protein
MLDNPGTRTAMSVGIGILLLGILLWVLPIIPMPTALIEAIEWLFTTLWSFNFMIPVMTLVSVVGILILVDVLFASIKLVLFLKRQFFTKV